MRKPARPFLVATLAALLSLTLFPWAYAASEKIRAEIAERLAPVGTVCVEGEACAATVTASTSSGEPRSGEEIYNKHCTACHAAGVAGAPMFGDASAWQPRVDLGMESLYQNSINGINAMPAKGLCMDCSDEEIQASVDYMIEALN